MMFNIDVINEIKRILIHESNALNKLCDYVGDNFLNAVKIIYESTGKLIVVGLGKSGIVGRKIAATMSSLGTSSVFLHAAEALHGDLGVIKSNDVLLMISNSGTTREVIEIIPYAKRIGVKIISITHNLESELAKGSDVVLPLIYDFEACPFNLAPTTSTIMTMAIGDALAITLTKLKNFQPKDFAMLHPAGALGQKLLIKVSDLMHTNDELPLANSNLTLLEVLPLMSEKKLGTLIVVDENNKLLGILTDGDLRRKLCQFGSNALTSKLIDIMTKNPKRITADKLCEEALNVMETYKITVLPVVDETDKIIGIIHMHDLLKAKIR